MIYFASAGANLQDLVALEARNAGANEIRVRPGGVEFSGDLATGYRFCLNARVASRLMLGIAEEEHIKSADDLYASSLLIPWETWLDPSKTFAVTVSAIRCAWLHDTTFAALKLKDAIADRLRSTCGGERPSVDTKHPDVTFHLHLSADQALWYLDFSGRSLFRRFYRIGDTKAILKENLASAVLMRSDWYKSLQDTEPGLLLDPFCGAGTIPIEAALIATDTAPGLLHPDSFAFLNLPMHDHNLWEQICEEAQERQRVGKQRNVRILAWDIDANALALATQHARRAGVEQYIIFEQKDFTKIAADDVPEGNNFVVTDPPYGVRMETQSSLESFYITMGKQFNNLFCGWKVSILCANRELLSYIDMKPQRTNTLYNGPLEAQLAHYQVFTRQERQKMEEKAIQKREERLSRPLSEGAQMVYNRLVKNLQAIQPLMESKSVTSYRIYDADMPEYSAAIDFYEGKWIHLQEYAAPLSIDPALAQRHLEELVDATERSTGVPRELIFIKERREQKGMSQYEKLASTEKFYIMHEHGLVFSVNFTDYLDTGIFLDHRPVRKMIMEMADGKRFLNLFCYTGTATVHAAAGGALSTVSVDASSTYLDWAMKNMRMNGFDGMNHFYYKSDCMDYLQSTHDMYDLIFCDPPTFSNSKMRNTFDVQRDHRSLIHAAMRHLEKGGTLIFSTNFRKFSLDKRVTEEYAVEDITEQTIDEDFSRNKKIHQCYLIRYRKASVLVQEKKKQPKKVVIKKERI